MPDWLAAFSLPSVPPQDFKNIVAAMVLSVLLGMTIGQIHRWTRPLHSGSASFHATLVLMTILITLVTQVIGDNVARAFSLVGALSIVRFRTVVRDTKDTAFVIFAVVIGMCAGAERGWLAIGGTILVGLVAAIYRDRPYNPSTSLIRYRLILRMGLAQEVETQVHALLQQVARSYDLESLSTVRQGSAMEMTYSLQLNRAISPRELHTQLSRIEGIQSVELTASIEEDR